MQWKSWIITSMHQNTLFKKPCDFRRGVSQKYSQIIVLFNSKCQNQKQTGSRVQRIGWKQPWITHTLFGGFEYYSAFDWGNYTYKSSTKITSWPNFNHKSQVSIKIIILFTGSSDATTKSETMNPEFSQFFSQTRLLLS